MKTPTRSYALLVLLALVGLVAMGCAAPQTDGCCCQVSADTSGTAHTGPCACATTECECGGMVGAECACTDTCECGEGTGAAVACPCPN